jgi:sirohydrochlorin ferrochelatase
MLMVTVRTGIVIFAHGSSVQSANDAVHAVARAAAQAGNFEHVEVAFLEAQPTLDAAVARLAERGAARILVIPYFLTLGIHLQRDLPAIVQRLAAEHPGLEIAVTPPLDGHPALVGIVLDRVRESLNTGGKNPSTD